MSEFDTSNQRTVEYVIVKYLQGMHCYQLAGLVKNNPRLLLEVLAVGGLKDINTGFSEFLEMNGLVNVVKTVLAEEKK